MLFIQTRVHNIRLTEMPRLFTGLEIPESISARLSLIRANLPDARWISVENYHITLRFMGDIDDHTANDLAYALSTINRPEFSVRLSGLTSFGSHKPRSIIASVEAHEALILLQRAHEQAARSVGLAPEPRNFTPHVTLARLRAASATDVAKFLENFGDFRCEPFQVGRFVLFSSRPSKGGGPYAIEQIYGLDNNKTFY